jgi:CrcB protein
MKNILFNLFCVASGGSIGAVSRYCIGKIVTYWFGTPFPYGTLFVNVVGSFFIGFILSCVSNDLIKLFFVVGFLGSFTTFSTFSMDTVSALMHGHLTKATIIVLANLFLCLVSTYLGILSGRFIGLQ